MELGTFGASHSEARSWHDYLVVQASIRLAHLSGQAAGLLDRLAAWQQEFDDHFHPWESGWRSAAIRDRWAHQAKDLAGVELYIRADRSMVSADLTPAEARKLAAQLIEHAGNVEDAL